VRFTTTRPAAISGSGRRMPPPSVLKHRAFDCRLFGIRRNWVFGSRAVHPVPEAPAWHLIHALVSSII
jgi:hypothetical protein